MRPYLKTLTLCFSLTVLCSCAQESEAQSAKTPHDPSVYVMADPAEDTFALGSRLTPEGAVASNSVQDLYNRGEKLFVAVNLDGSSRPRRDVEVRWHGAKGTEVKRDRSMVDVRKRFATFESGMTSSWAPGAYRAVVIIDGREVAERRFRLK